MISCGEEFQKHAVKLGKEAPDGLEKQLEKIIIDKIMASKILYTKNLRALHNFMYETGWG